MIHPLPPSTLAGVRGYQGESNSARPAEYRDPFPSFITDLRAFFARPDLPFYWVQLASFIGSPGEDWTALALPRTGQAIAINVSVERNIHPTNKQDVGLRLALMALRKHHAKPSSLPARSS